MAPKTKGSMDKRTKVLGPVWGPGGTQEKVDTGGKNCLTVGKPTKAKGPAVENPCPRNARKGPRKKKKMQGHQKQKGRNGFGKDLLGSSAKSWGENAGGSAGPPKTVSGGWEFEPTQTIGEVRGAERTKKGDQKGGVGQATWGGGGKRDNRKTQRND